MQRLQSLRHAQLSSYSGGHIGRPLRLLGDEDIYLYMMKRLNARHTLSSHSKCLVINIYSTAELANKRRRPQSHSRQSCPLRLLELYLRQCCRHTQYKEQDLTTEREDRAGLPVTVSRRLTALMPRLSPLRDAVTKCPCRSPSRRRRRRRGNRS